MVPGVPSGDRENWGYESLLDRSHVCFYEESLGKTNAKDFELFLNGSAHKFNCLKAVITLEQHRFLTQSLLMHSVTNWDIQH